MNNVAAQDRLRPGELTVALDVDVDDQGGLRTREGMARLSATASHSIWSRPGLCLVMQGSDLKRMDSAGNLTTLRRLSHDGPVAYAPYDGAVYFSNGLDTGRIARDGRCLEWGIRLPAGQPAAAPTGGQLPPGDYRYAVTYVRADGLESGSPLSGVVTLTDVRGSGIAFSGLPSSSDPEVAGVAIYIALPGGAELLRAAVVPVGESTYTYSGPGTDLTYALPQGLVEPAPAGTVLAVHSGVTYVADGNVAWASDRFSPERFRRQTRFLQLPGPIQVMLPVQDGLFVATDAETWFFAGHDPEAMVPRQVLSHGGTFGTGVTFDSLELVAEESQAGASVPAALWHSPFGVILGTSGGQVKNLTEDRYSFPEAVRGGAYFRTARGFSSYVLALQAPGGVNNAH